MKKNAVVFLFLFFLLNVNAQEYAKYWVQFADKKGTPYSVSKPEEFLSVRAIQLRQKHQIPVDEKDLPINPAYIRQVLAVDSNMRLCITVYSEVENILDSIVLLPCVAFVEKTVPMKEPETTPDTPFVFVAGGVQINTYLSDIKENKDFDYGAGETQIRMNNGHWLHRMGFRGEKMRMMVMDGGFKNVDTLYVFENMRNDNRLLGARNLVQPGSIHMALRCCRALPHTCQASWWVQRRWWRLIFARRRMPEAKTRWRKITGWLVWSWPTVWVVRC